MIQVANIPEIQTEMKGQTSIPMAMSHEDCKDYLKKMNTRSWRPILGISPRGVHLVIASGVMKFAHSRLRFRLSHNKHAPVSPAGWRGYVRHSRTKSRESAKNITEH